MVALPVTSDQFVYIAPIIIGAAIGILEVIFVHSDQPGFQWLGHGLHAIPTVIIFTFLAMNVNFIYNLLGLSFTSDPKIDIGIRVAIGLIAALKVKFAAAITKGSHGSGEHWPHALIIGGLIAASPYIWTYVAPFLPEIVKK